MFPFLGAPNDYFVWFNFFISYWDRSILFEASFISVFFSTDSGYTLWDLELYAEIGGFENWGWLVSGWTWYLVLKSAVDLILSLKGESYTRSLLFFMRYILSWSISEWNLNYFWSLEADVFNFLLADSSFILSLRFFDFYISSCRLLCDNPGSSKPWGTPCAIVFALVGVPSLGI